MYFCFMNAIKHIKLTESHAQSLLRHACAENENLIVQVEELRARVEELQLKINENNALIEVLEGNSANGINGSSGSTETTHEIEKINGSIVEEYDSSWSLSKRISYIIKESDKTLLAGEIVNAIIDKSPSAYPSDEEKRKLSVSVYASLNSKFNNGELSRRNTPSGYRYQIKEKKEQL